MQPQPAFKSFEDYWPYYVDQHQSRAVRRAHFAGITAALTVLAYGLARRRPRALAWVAPLALVPGWIAHRLVAHGLVAERPEHASPHPWWALYAGMRMYGKMWAGTMDAEVQRVGALDPKPWQQSASAGPTRRSNGASARVAVEVEAQPSRGEPN